MSRGGLAVILSVAKNLIQYGFAGAITSARLSRFDRGAGAWMRFFVAEGAPQNDGGFFGDVRSRGGASRLDHLAQAQCFGKAAAEPPHSKVGWAWLALRTLRDGYWPGLRVLRTGWFVLGGSAEKFLIWLKLPPFA